MGIKNCPKCGVSLEGGLIYYTFLLDYGDKKKALEAAAMYGATEMEGRWRREIGIYDLETDETVKWRCPDCGHEWDR